MCGTALEREGAYVMESRDEESIKAAASVPGQ